MRPVIIIKAQTLIIALCALLASMMIIDYVLVGKLYVEEVISVNKSLERYYNAGGNSHYSFHIKTKSFNFPVSENFASLVKVGQEQKIEISLLFKEVNSAEIIKNGNKEIYSLRAFSGLILPIFILFILFYKRKKKFSVLILVIAVVTVFNLVYLLN